MPERNARSTSKISFIIRGARVERDKRATARPFACDSEELRKTGAAAGEQHTPADERSRPELHQGRSSRLPFYTQQIAANSFQKGSTDVQRSARAQQVPLSSQTRRNGERKSTILHMAFSSVESRRIDGAKSGAFHSETSEAFFTNSRLQSSRKTRRPVRSTD